MRARQQITHRFVFRFELEHTRIEGDGLINLPGAMVEVGQVVQR